MSYTGCCGLGNGSAPTAASSFTLRPSQPQFTHLIEAPKQELCYDSSGNFRVPCDYPGALTAEEARVPGYLYESEETYEDAPDATTPEMEACWAQGGEWDYMANVCVMGAPPQEDKPNLLMWGAIIGGSALVLGGGVYLITRKKKGR